MGHTTDAAKRAAHRRRTRLYPLLAVTAATAVLAAWPRPAPSPVAVAVAARTPTGPEITLAFGGDVHVEGEIADSLDRDPAALFGELAGPLRDADVSVVNLETAVGSRGEPAAKKYVFRAPASVFDALSAAGVDAVSLANNHALDYGPTALADAVEAAAAAGVGALGAGADEAAAFRPWTTTVDGQRVTVLASTQVLDTSLQSSWTAGPDHPGVASAKQPERLLAQVRQARDAGGLVVVYLHWGREKDPCPTPEGKLLAQQLVDAGADVVVGTHAHVRSGDGYLGDAYVHYGLGNLLWYSGHDRSKGGLLTLTARGRAVTGASWLPVRMERATPVRAPDEPLPAAARTCAGLAPAPR